MRVFVMVVMWMSALSEGCSQATVKLRVDTLYLSNPYQIRDDETAELIERTFAVEGLDHPIIIRKEDDTMLVTNPILHESNDLAEYITPNKRNADKKLIKRFEVDAWEVIKLLQHESDYRNDRLKQLNFYDRMLYYLYSRNSMLELVRYDTLNKTFSKVAVLKDNIQLARYTENIDFTVSGNLLLISNSFTKDFIVVDPSTGEVHYTELPQDIVITQALGIKGDQIYFIESSGYRVRSINYKNSKISQVGKLAFEKKNIEDDTISYYLDLDKMLLYISYFDFKELCLMASVYTL